MMLKYIRRSDFIQRALRQNLSKKMALISDAIAGWSLCQYENYYHKSDRWEIFVLGYL